MSNKETQEKSDISFIFTKKIPTSVDVKDLLNNSWPFKYFFTLNFKLLSCDTIIFITSTRE